MNESIKKDLNAILSDVIALTLRNHNNNNYQRTMVVLEWFFLIGFIVGLIPRPLFAVMLLLSIVETIVRMSIIKRYGPYESCAPSFLLLDSDAQSYFKAFFNNRHFKQEEHAQMLWDLTVRMYTGKASDRQPAWERAMNHENHQLWTHYIHDNQLTSHIALLSNLHTEEQRDAFEHRPIEDRDVFMEPLTGLLEYVTRIRVDQEFRESELQRLAIPSSYATTKHSVDNQFRMVMADRIDESSGDEQPDPDSEGDSSTSAKQILDDSPENICGFSDV